MSHTNFSRQLKPFKREPEQPLPAKPCQAARLRAGQAPHLPSIRLWLLALADANAERAVAIELREPFLAKLLLQDAEAARQQAALLSHD